MKRPLETAIRWLAQAEHNLEVSRVMLNSGFWSNVCFECEQTAQLALKAFLFSKGRRFVLIHSISELASECGKEDDAFLRFQEGGKVLDGYYIPTRYPDALPAPAIPFESFTEEQARHALDIATEIVETVRARIPEPEED